MKTRRGPAALRASTAGTFSELASASRREIDEGLQRGTRIPENERAVHLGLGVGSFERRRCEHPHRAGRVLDDDDGGVSDVPPGERAEPVTEESPGAFLQFEVEGRVHDPAVRRSPGGLGEPRRTIAGRIGEDGGRTGGEFLAQFGRDDAQLPEPREGAPVSRVRPPGVAPRVEPARRLRKPGEENRLGHGEPGRRLPEIAPGGGLGADAPVSVVQPV